MSNQALGWMGLEIGSHREIAQLWKLDSVFRSLLTYPHTQSSEQGCRELSLDFTEDFPKPRDHCQSTRHFVVYWLPLFKLTVSHLWVYHLGCHVLSSIKASTDERDRWRRLGILEERSHWTAGHILWGCGQMPPSWSFPCLSAFLKGGHFSNIHLLGFLLQIKEYYVNNILITL